MDENWIYSNTNRTQYVMGSFRKEAPDGDKKNKQIKQTFIVEDVFSSLNLIMPFGFIDNMK